MSDDDSVWEQQWDRIKRGYAEIERTDAGRVHDRPSDNYRDSVYHFFQDCYHLKDWLRNDPRSADDVQDVETYINGSMPLKIAGDIANGAKHLKLRTTRTGDFSTALGRTQFHLGLGAGADTTVSADYDIESGGSTYDAFDVASDCMRDWETYLQQESLL